MAAPADALPGWVPVAVSLFVGLGGLLFALFAWIRAGRAAKLAEDANSRAIIADARAEEAHTILKKRFATDEERAAADLEAPAIADRWIGHLRLKAQEAQQARRKHGALSVSVTTLAERMAVERIREKKQEHGIIEVSLTGEDLVLTMWTPFQQNQRRRRSSSM